MNVCRDCIEDRLHGQPNETPFPSYSILAGLIGTLAGVFTGNLLLIPLCLFPGIGVDATRCALCGSQNDVHKIVMEQTDTFDNKFYRSPPFRTPIKNEESITFVESNGIFTKADDGTSISYSCTNPEFDFDASLESDFGSFGETGDSFGEGGESAGGDGASGDGGGEA